MREETAWFKDIIRDAHGVMRSLAQVIAVRSATSRNAERRMRWLALIAYALLLTLVVTWEAWLAPATPVTRAFWLGVKTIPLLVVLPGLWRGSDRVHVLATLLVLLYFCEGVATAYTGGKAGALRELAYGAGEIFAALLFIGAASFYVRLSRRRATAPNRAETES